jgi:hypothetical protein
MFLFLTCLRLAYVLSDSDSVLPSWLWRNSRPKTIHRRSGKSSSSRRALPSAQLPTAHRPPPASVASCRCHRCQLPDVVTLAATADRVARLCEQSATVALDDAMSPQERSWMASGGSAAVAREPDIRGRLVVANKRKERVPRLGDSRLGGD